MSKDYTRISTQRLLKIYRAERKRYDCANLEDWEDLSSLCEQLELMKKELDTREHIPDKKRKDNLSGKRKRGTKFEKQSDIG